MQVEEYLGRDDRVVLPIGSTEQHGYLSLAVDAILAERVSVEAAEPVGVPVLPAMRFLVVNGHGGNTGAEDPLLAWARERDAAALRFHSWWASRRTTAAAEALHPHPSHANWFENFPWTRLAGVSMPAEDKPVPQIDERDDPVRVREILGDGTFGGAYERPDEDMLGLWTIAVDAVRELLESGW